MGETKMIQVNPTRQELAHLIKANNLQQDSVCSSLYVNEGLVLSCNSDHNGVVHVFVNKALFNKITKTLK